MVRKTFNNRVELLELLERFKWDSDIELLAHKMKITYESSIGKWRWVVFDEDNQTKWINSPQGVAIYLDRHKEVKGFMVLHGTLDSYIINGEGKL